VDAQADGRPKRQEFIDLERRLDSLRRGLPRQAKGADGVAGSANAGEHAFAHL
jgi:hypothetical protein